MDWLKNLNEDTFCILPFISMQMLPKGDAYPCCIFARSQSVGNANNTSVIELFNSDKMKEVRSQLMRNEIPSGCSYCHKWENMKAERSFRAERNSFFLGKSNVMDILKSCEPDGTLPSYRMLYMDVRGTNLCNLQCVMCSGEYSSAHQAVKNRIMRIEPSNGVVELSTDIWDQIDIKEVEYIHFAGGEPLMDHNHHRIIKQLIDSDQSQFVHLYYNTNLTLINNDNISDWSKFKKVEIFASIDGTPQVNDLIRYPSRSEKVFSNLKVLLDAGIDVKVSMSVSAMNIIDVPKFIDFLRDNYYKDPKFENEQFISFNTVFSPHYMNAQALSDAHKRVVKSTYDDWIKRQTVDGRGKINIDTLNGLLAFMNEKPGDYKKLKEFLETQSSKTKQNYLTLIDYAEI